MFTFLDHYIYEFKDEFPIECIDIVDEIFDNSAATAIHHGYILVTRNSKDFEKVEGLKLFRAYPRIQVTILRGACDEAIHTCNVI